MKPAALVCLLALCMCTSSSGFYPRRILQQLPANQPNNSSTNTTGTSANGTQLLAPESATALATADARMNSSTFESHQCLWTASNAIAVAWGSASAFGAVTSVSAAAATSSVSTAAASSSSATAAASSSSSATATASATAVASTPVTPSGSCSLNPSFFFSLTAPAQDGERLLLQITAMRYACLNNTAEPTCSADQPNWCLWQTAQDDAASSKGHCELSFGDADAVHFLMWSQAKLPCAGSKVAQIVKCSFGVSADACGKTAGCEWTEGACYPTWYGPSIVKPALLAQFKKKVQLGDPEVWGAQCTGAQLYRQYSSICNHPTRATCQQDPVGCTYVAEYDAEVAANPLNFTKPCVLSLAKFPLESVFLGDASSPFASAVMDVQRACMSVSDEQSCNVNKTVLSFDVLEAALNFSASTMNRTEPPSTAAGGTVVTVKGPANTPPSSADVRASNTEMPPAAPTHDQLPATPDPASTGPSSTSKSAGQAPEPQVAAQSVGSGHVDRSAPSAAAGGSTTVVTSTATATTSSVFATASAPAGGGVVASVSSGSSDNAQKQPGIWLTKAPIQTSESLLTRNGFFAIAEYAPGKANTPGTRAALSSLRLLLRLR